jgi:hypothetical protein
MTKIRLAPDLLLPEDVVTSTLVIYGGKGMGKTNFGSVLIEELTKAHLRWCLLDPMGVSWGLRHSKDGKGKGIECVILGGAHGDIPIEPTGGAIVADLVVDENSNVIIDFSRKANGQMWTKGERIRFVTDYTVRLFERQGELVGGRRREPLMQILDEAARYIPQTIPSGATDLAKCVGAWEQVCEEGRNIGLGVAFLTQRSARMNKSVSELADVMVAFRTIGPNSLDAILDWLGEHIEKARIRDLAAKVRELNVGQALVVSPGWLRVEKVVQIRERETFDSSATPKAGQRAQRVSGEAAKPDLAKYESRMAATIEKVKADDPKELRKRIAQLEKEVAAKPVKATTAPVVDHRALERAVKDAERVLTAKIINLRKALESAMKFIVNISTANFDVAGVNKEELERAITAAVGKATQVIDQRLTARSAAVEKVREEAKRLLATLKAIADEQEITVSVDVAKNEPYSVSAPAARRPTAPARVIPTDGVSVGQQKILNALAELRAIGIKRPSRVQLSLFASMSLNGGSGGQNVADLVTLGLAEIPDKGLVALTEAGIAAASADAAPSSLDELHARVLGKLPAGQQKILGYLLSVYPSVITRTELGESVEMSLNGGSGGQNVADLVTLGTVRIPGKGQVVASELMFQDGLR